MAVAPILTEQPPARAGYLPTRPARPARQATRLLEDHLQRLVERVAALVDAPRASLVVLDPTTQTLLTLAASPGRFSGPLPAPLRLHEAITRWMLQQRGPAIITDGARDPQVRVLGLLIVGSLLSVPLLAEQQVLGALTISSPAIHAFRPHHLRLLEMVADLATLALVQTRQLGEVAQPTQPLTLPLDVSRGPDLSGDRGIFSLAVSAIRQLVPCEEAVMYTYDAGTETLCGVAGLDIHSTRLADARIRLRDPQSVTAWAAQQRRPLLLAGGATGFMGRATETLLAERELALLAVPLVAHERLWGVIGLRVLSERKTTLRNSSCFLRPPECIYFGGLFLVSQRPSRSADLRRCLLPA